MRTNIYFEVLLKEGIRTIIRQILLFLLCNLVVIILLPPFFNITSCDFFIIAPLE